MNEDNAKSPRGNNSANWDAIDIFIFTNGQERSPPRKYHITSRELALWDGTLNYMARTLYSWQVPAVDIYTLDGDKIETPLQLTDGTAYVAVAATDSFKAVGYDKYLMRANKNVPYTRSLEKQQKKSCCNTDCINQQAVNRDFNDTNANNQTNETPKIYAHVTEIISEAHVIIPVMDDAKVIGKNNLDAKEEHATKFERNTVRSAKPNAPIVKPQQQTKTLFRRSLTPSPRTVDFDKKTKKENLPTGKINTNQPVQQPTKKSFLKSPIRKSPKPTHKLNDTLNTNFESVPTDAKTTKNNNKALQNYTTKKANANNSGKISSLLKLVSMGNSQEVIHTIKAETSDLNKRLSVPNMYYSESKQEKTVSDKHTSTTIITATDNHVEQGTGMSNKHSAVTNDALISLNKEEFQTIVDRIVERILDEKTNNASKKETTRPKLVYAKVTQSMTEDGLLFDRHGRVVTVMNEGEVVNFKVNIEVANMDDTRQRYQSHTKPKNIPSDYSDYTSSSTAFGDGSPCNDLCECQQSTRQPQHYYGSKSKAQKIDCECVKYYASSISSHDSNPGDVRNDQKTKIKNFKKTIGDNPNAKVSPSNKLENIDDTKTNNRKETEVFFRKGKETKKKPVDVSTQTNGLSDILLEAKEYPDGRYTFHLPPLQVLRYYNI